jgi:two-component system, chemotaxis family, response regulator PixG
MPPQLDPFLLLTQIANDQKTGCLEVTYGSIQWNIFLRFGQLLRVDCSVQSLGQLIHRLDKLGCEDAAQALKINLHNDRQLSTDNWVQQEVDKLAEQKLLKSEHLRHIYVELTKEALESFLWLRTGDSHWHPDRLIPKTSASSGHFDINLSALLDYYQQQLAIWQKFGTVIRSPHQRPYLTNVQRFDKIVPGGVLSPKGLRQIAQLMKGSSFRELALFLDKDELKLAQLLVPYIQHDLIFVREPSAPFNQLPMVPPSSTPKQTPQIPNSTSSESKVYQIACIDDSPTVLDEIERFLGNQGKYQLTRLEEPIKASSTILRLKPDLILMDITMPNINGYKLCSLFRSSEALAHTPIIMVTGNKGLVDQVRAKMVGATDYLTKPFTQEKLLGMVEKYLS